MALLFYTTEYKPERAQSEIQKLLRSMGARKIILDYAGRDEIAGMSFTLETPQGEREFLLPARIDRVKETLQRQGVLKSTRPLEHATAVAWRTLLEWVKVQAAMYETHQAAADEIMLPYLLIPSERRGEVHTLYEQFSADRALPAGG